MYLVPKEIRKESFIFGIVAILAVWRDMLRTVLF